MISSPVFLSAPLTPDKKRKQDETINRAEQASQEARQVSERLRRAAKLYRERLTGVVEDK